MRLAVLWVVLAIGAGVFVAMLAAMWRHRAQATTVVLSSASEYVWALIPWLIMALCVAPAVHGVIAAESDGTLDANARKRTRTNDSELHRMPCSYPLWVEEKCYWEKTRLWAVDHPCGLAPRERADGEPRL